MHKTENDKFRPCLSTLNYKREILLRDEGRDKSYISMYPLTSASEIHNNNECGDTSNGSDLSYSSN